MLNTAFIIMNDIIFQALSNIHPLSDGLKNYLNQNLKELHLNKKEIYLHNGEINNKISFIIKGFLRSYYITDEGIDTTVWFMKEGDVCISVKSFYERTASEEFIQAQEQSILLYISYHELQEAYKLFPEFNIIGRKLTEKYYVLSEERLLGIRNKKAKDRYAFLLKHHPEIAQRALVQHIASYLDIDKHRLSKIRAQF